MKLNFRSIVTTGLLIGACALSGLTAKADQGVQDVRPNPRSVVPLAISDQRGGPVYTTFTNTVCTANTSGTNTTAQIPGQPLPAALIDVIPGTILSLQYSVYCGAAGNSNHVIQISKTIDDKLLETTPSLSVVNANNGTSTNTYVAIVGTNINARAVAITGFGSAQTNAVTLTNVVPVYTPVF